MQLSVEQQQLVEDSMALVRRVIRDKVRGAGRLGSFTYEDLFQTGCIGLCKAAYTDKYQYANNRQNSHTEDETRFSTYAYRLIWNEICNKLEYVTKMRAESVVDPEEIEFLASDERGQLDGGFADTDMKVTLEQAMDAAAKGTTGITAKGIQALKYMAEGYTSTEIARMMGGGSCHNVTAWISKARKHLKSNPDLVKLMYPT